MFSVKERRTFAGSTCNATASRPLRRAKSIGGTIKLFYGTLVGTQPPAASAGRGLNAGAGSFQP